MVSDRFPSINLALAFFLAFPTVPALADGASPMLSLPQPTQAAAATCSPVDANQISSNPMVLQLTFLDDFLGTTLDATKWQTHFQGDGTQEYTRTLSGNGEKEIYVDPAYAGSGATPLKLNPFTVANGILTITVDKTPAELLSVLYNLPFTSGVITTVNSFQQTYGYFEVRMKAPRGTGLWPAFWMLRPSQWPPEIDIMEGEGSNPGRISMTTHWKENGVGAHEFSYCFANIQGGDDTEFHSYGVLWTASRIVNYIDRVPVNQMLTPAGLDQPMYMLVNLAVDKTVTDSTPMPSSYDIDWVAAYAQ